MTLQEARSHFEYNEWANARFVTAFQALSSEQLTAHIESSFPSILLTFAHLVGAEWIWLRRWKGESPDSFPGWVKKPDFEKAQSILADVEAERRTFLESLQEEDLERIIDYKTLSGNAFTTRLMNLFLHLVNHSSYHRGQLTTMLRQVGATPPATDFVVYKRERSTAPQQGRRGDSAQKT